MLKDEEEVSEKSHEENIEQTSPNPNINIFGAGFFMMYAEDSEKLADKQESNLDPKDVEDPAVEYKLKGNQQDAEDPALEDKEIVAGHEKVAEDRAIEEKEKLNVYEKDAKDPNVKESKKIDDKEDPSLDADDSVVEETEKLEENIGMKDPVMEEDGSNDKNVDQDQVQIENSILDELVIEGQQGLEEHERDNASEEVEV